MKLTIKPDLEIGDDLPPFIIAEIGSNWRTLDDCLLSIEKAKACGADAVKFQLFTPWDLYGVKETKDLSVWDEHIEQTSAATGYSLPVSWLPKLKEKADAHGVEFMCSAFSPELLEAVDPFVNIHKVASAEMCHVRMLHKLRKIGKPVILSTGSHTLEEIGRAIDLLVGVNASGMRYPTFNGVLMYCVAAYPAKVVDLRGVSRLQDYFGALAGYSDHSTDVLEIPHLACNEYQACVLEKHVTFIDAETPDSPHSLNETQFKQMVQVLKPGSLSFEIGPTLEEKGMLLRHNRRLIAIQDIKKGDIFVEDLNFGIYRALKDMPNALSPFMVKSVNGLFAKCDIQAGDGIEVEDL